MVADPETGILFERIGDLITFKVNDTYFPDGMVANITVSHNIYMPNPDYRYQLRVGKKEHSVTRTWPKDHKLVLFWSVLALDQQAFWGQRMYGWVLGGILFFVILFVISILWMQVGMKQFKSICWSEWGYLAISACVLATAIDYVCHLYNPLGFQDAITPTQENRTHMYAAYYVVFALVVFPIIPGLTLLFHDKGTRSIVRLVFNVIAWSISMFVIPIPGYFIVQGLLFIVIIIEAIFIGIHYHKKKTAKEKTESDKKDTQPLSTEKTTPATASLSRMITQRKVSSPGYFNFSSGKSTPARSRPSTYHIRKFV